MISSINTTTPMKMSSPYLLFLTACLLLSYLSKPSDGISMNATIQCIDHEREALLEFKQGIEVDNCGLLSSWGDHRQPDCCTWHGVRCSHKTRHVIMLNLQGVDPDGQQCLQGKVGPSLLELRHLTSLDLSSNYFEGQPIPRFIGSLSKLQHLNLSYAGFQGEIPPQLGNLSQLTSLDLSCQEYYTDLHVKGLSWLSRLTMLQVINLNWIDLSKAANWLQVVNNLPLLRTLRMNGCQLLISPTSLSSLSYINSTATLGVLSLTDNELNDTSIFQWLFNLTGTATHLVHVDLSDNHIPGPVPRYFGNMCFLSYLSLAWNNLQGPIPSACGSMHSLSYLDLSWNRLYGPFPSALGNMNSLSQLLLSHNQLQGVIPDTLWNLDHLINLQLNNNNFHEITPPKSHAGAAGLCSLQTLDLSYNNLTDELSIIIQPLSARAYRTLAYLDLSSNMLQGKVPESVNMFSSLTYLDLSDNMLQGTLSERHFSNLSRLSTLSLSGNLALVVNVSVNWIPSFQLDYIDLSYCKLGPAFPKWLSTQTNYSWLDLANTRIADSIPPSFFETLSSSLTYLNMSHNKIFGVLPSFSVVFYNSPRLDLSSNCLKGAIPLFPLNVSSLILNNNKFTNAIPLFSPKTKLMLSHLDLSNNLLSGMLPNNLTNFDQLSVLHLENNNFTGVLPMSVSALKQLVLLHLRNNTFYGELPMSLENCTSLVILDLSYNSFTGYIPPRIGSTLKRLVVFNLRNNYLGGSLPLSLCQMSYLQILDLSANHMSGTIPQCIYKLQAMTNSADFSLDAEYVKYIVLPLDTSFYTATVMWKRKEQSFRNTLGLVKSIAISDNNLEGKIPGGITSLAGLVSLDLSRNNLTGSIPSKFGQLKALQYLDLSSNHLSGSIPASLATVTSLEIMDLSNNNLSGRIPVGTQLQGFDPSAYSGNPQLCGPPLPKCLGDQAPTNRPKGDNIIPRQEGDSDDIFPGLYISVVVGFITGFWGVCGSLVLKRSWRHACFRFIDDVRDRLHMMYVATIAGARTWMREGIQQ